MRDIIKKHFLNKKKISLKSCLISAEKYDKTMNSISFDGMPLFNQGSGKIDNENLNLAKLNLIKLLKLYKKFPSMFKQQTY